VPRVSLSAAIGEVAARDAVLADLVALAGPIRGRSHDPDGHFGALARAIVFQQLAGAAADAIHCRVRALIDGPLTPQTISAVPDEALRAAGLSANKLAALRDLSDKVMSGDVVLGASSGVTDDEIVANLTTVRGIGRWTAEMYLMYQLGRLDVWPVGDLGVRRATALRGTSKGHRPRRSWRCSVIASVHTVRSSPATAGRLLPFSGAAPTPASDETHDAPT